MLNLLCTSTLLWQTSPSDIEAHFVAFTQERKDIAILLINQHIAEKIRPLVDKYTQAFPALLEIPSKDHPYGERQFGSAIRCAFVISPSSLWLHIVKSLLAGLCAYICPLTPHLYPSQCSTDPSKDSVLKRVQKVSRS